MHNLLISIFFILCTIFFTYLGYSYFTKKNNFIINAKKMLLTLIIIFSCILIFFIISTNNKNSIKNEKNIKEIKNINNNFKGNIKQYNLNKIIIIGDSRMSLIEDSDILDIPSSFNFIAKSGAKFDWFNNEALNTLKSKLNSAKNNVHYHVILNMGVNDLTFSDANVSIFEKYYNAYQKLAKKYSNVDFYVLSINPVVDDLVENNWHGKSNVTSMIEKYNYISKNKIKNAPLKNLHFCNSYNNIEFKTMDGLHYDYSTNKKILNYISNKCILLT